MDDEGFQEHQDSAGRPVLRRVFLVLVLVSFLGPLVAAAVAEFLANAYRHPPWLDGLIIGGITTLSVTLLVYVRAMRVQERLSQIQTWLRSTVAGASLDRLKVTAHDETAALRHAINRMSTYLAHARAASSDQRFLQNVIDTLPDPLVVLDANGVVELSNSRFSALLSFDGTLGPVGRGLGTLAGTQMPSWYREILDTGTVAAIEVDFMGPDGEAISLLASGALLRDESDLPSRVVLLVRDPGQLEKLSARLEDAQAKAAESAAVFQNLFDAIEDPITVLGLNGTIIQANRAARAMFGKKLVGQKCYRAFRMKESMCEECPASLTYANKRSTVVEHRVFGNAITRINTYPLLGKNGEVRAILNHKRDVTNERQLEELKASFLAAVSHELRTPLTSIIGFNKLNRRRMTRHLSAILETAPHKARIAFQQILDDMDIMVSEGGRLGRLVNDILDLSKLEAGRMQLQMDQVDIVQVINGAVAATSALWRAKELQVRCDFETEIPSVWGDADRLAQVVVNLLSNATKFTDEGYIEIDVEFDDTAVTVVIRDTGRGIPPDQVNGVFEKFRQVDEPVAAGPLGTGLGLPICRELVHLHGGRIWVESVLGQGSVFRFTVLRSDPRNEPAIPQDRMSFTGEF